MRLALITLVLLLVGLSYGVFGQALADNLHEEDACPMQSWSQKTGPTEFWWKAVTACNDHNAEELNHFIKLQQFNWSNYTWENTYPQFQTSDFFTDFLADSRFWDVDAYLGANCYRIKTVHYVVEWAKGLYTRDISYSLGRCY